MIPLQTCRSSINTVLNLTHINCLWWFHNSFNFLLILRIRKWSIFLKYYNDFETDYIENLTDFLNEIFQEIKTFELIKIICIAKINIIFAHVHHHLAYFKVTLRASKRQLFFDAQINFACIEKIFILFSFIFHEICMRVCLKDNVFLYFASLFVKKDV